MLKSREPIKKRVQSLRNVTFTKHPPDLPAFVPKHSQLQSKSHFVGVCHIANETKYSR